MKRFDDFRTVLLVDDSDTLRWMLHKELAKRTSIRVVEATSALAALTLLEQGGIDVVVSDLTMPGLKGDALLNEVGQRWPGVRRLLLTAWATGDRAADAPYPVLPKVGVGAFVIVDTIVRLARAA